LLLIKHLIETGCIDKTKGLQKELTIIMDNCGGQNKNQIMICLVPLLVELQWYEKVNFAFLIAGHTQNSCDHLFNILKLKHQKSNIFLPEMLVKTVNKCNLVDAVCMKEGDFKDYDKFLDLHHSVQLFKNAYHGHIRIRLNNYVSFYQ